MTSSTRGSYNQIPEVSKGLAINNLRATKQQQINELVIQFKSEKEKPMYIYKQLGCL